MTGWSLARPDWQERIRQGRSLLPDLPLLDRPRADRAIGVYRNLKIPDIPGTPTFGTAGGPWFEEIVGAMHGSWDPVAKERHIRELFLLVPKKNAKTTKGAGLMLPTLLLNERPRAEFLIVAPTQKIALLAFGQLTGMIEGLPPKFVQRFHVQDHLKKVTYLPTQATLEIKSFDPKVMTGVKPAGILIDELHVIAESADADRVIGQIRGGIVSQPEAFFAFITTQSERPPRGVFLAELTKARAIRDGRATGKMLPVLYEFPDEIALAKRAPDEPYAWENPKVWHMVTPNNGRSITVERLVEDYETAKLAGPGELIRWASQHLNIEVGLALRDDRWAGADHWLEAAEEPCTLEEFLDRCDVVAAGIDGGGLDDLLALTLVGREKSARPELMQEDLDPVADVDLVDDADSDGEDLHEVEYVPLERRRWLLWNRSWAHPSVLERRKKEASVLQDFASQGDLVLVQNLGDDVQEVASIIALVDRRGLLFKVGLDPIGIGEIVDALEARGIGEDRRVGISQGWKLAGAIKDAERAVASGRLRHFGQPIMAWAIGNAKTEPRGNAVMITKQVSGSAKVDPLMAAFNAVALMSMNPEPQGSVYTADRGLLFF